MLPERRDEAAATAFFKQTIEEANGFPRKGVMVKSGSNYAGRENINFLLMLAGLISIVEKPQVK
jgi:putative transposase